MAVAARGADHDSVRAPCSAVRVTFCARPAHALETQAMPMKTSKQPCVGSFRRRPWEGPTQQVARPRMFLPPNKPRVRERGQTSKKPHALSLMQARWRPLPTHLGGDVSRPCIRGRSREDVRLGAGPVVECEETPRGQMPPKTGRFRWRSKPEGGYDLLWGAFRDGGSSLGVGCGFARRRRLKFIFSLSNLGRCSRAAQNKQVGTHGRRRNRPIAWLHARTVKRHGAGDLCTVSAAM